MANDSDRRQRVTLAQSAPTRVISGLKSGQSRDKNQAPFSEGRARSAPTSLDLSSLRRDGLGSGAGTLAAGGIMVFLSGPRRGVPRVKLHNPPPGYRPPHAPRVPLKEQRRRARRDGVIMRAATVVLLLAAAAFIVIIFVIIATHH